MATGTFGYVRIDLKPLKNLPSVFLPKNKVSKKLP